MAAVKAACIQSGRHCGEHPAPWDLFGDDLKKKNRDQSDSITTTFRGVPVCFAEGNLGAM
jgi:hypothetical protein